MPRPTYEGAFADVPPPSHHVISRLEQADVEPLPVDVIKIPVLEPRDRNLVITYEILVHDIDDKEAIRLIIEVILAELTDHFYRAAVDTITFENCRSLVRQTLAYPS
jgi:hypothetical protein